MTSQFFRHSTSSGQRACPCWWALIIAIAVGCSLAACGGDDVEGTGDLIDVTVTPEAGYPDVEIEVSFAIEPGDDADEQEYGWNVDFGDGNRRAGDGTDGSATHSYDAPDHYLITIEALYDGDVVDSTEIEFPVYDPIDLSVDTVRIQPANVLVGENATISFDVTNETASPILTPFTVRTYVSEGAQFSREELVEQDFEQLVPLGEQRLEGGEDDVVLDGGQHRNVSVTASVPEVPTGDYHGVVVIDPEQQLQMTNPDQTIAASTNTVQIENVDLDLPNISVQGLEVLPDRAFPELNQFTRAFTLANVGGEDVFEVVHKTYLQVGSRQLDESAQLVHTSDATNLTAQQEILIEPEQFVLSEPIVPQAGQEQDVYVIVEAFSEDGDVEEATQTNNVLSSDSPIVVSDQPVNGPDIAVRDFSMSPDGTFLGGTLELAATIANEGTDDVSSFFCGIYMNPEPKFEFDTDPQITTVNVLGLEAGEVTEIEREISIPSLYDAGVYYFYIVCDPVGAIDQPFRGNSQAMHLDPIRLTDEADIDLYVQSVSAPDSADDGDTVTVDSTICVAGSNPSGTTTGELYTAPGGEVDFEATPYKSFELPNINPGECIERQFDVTAECRDFSDELSIGLFVDADGSLPEEDTSNNQATTDNPVILKGLYCECVDDEFGSNQSTASAYVVDPEAEQPKQGALCDAGECDFYITMLDEGDSLVVNTEHDTERGPLEIALFAPGGTTQIDFDDNDDFQQVAVFNAGDDGLPYVFSVCGQDTDTRNYYDFSVDVIPQPEIVDVLPRNITIPPQDSFSIGSLIDVDLRIHNIGEEVTGEFDVDLILTKHRDAEQLGGPEDITLATHSIDSLSPSSHRDVSLEAPLATQVDDGDYYIGVVLDPNEVLNEENRDNNIDFSPQFTIQTECYDDFSPNDSFSQATPVDPGNYSNLIACADSGDYYEICAPNAHSLDVTVDGFNPDHGDIDITLYDHALNAIDSSAQTGVDTEQVGVDYVDGDQCYYLRVVLVSLDENAENTYSLSVDVTEVEPELQCDPMFEPNDDFENASSLWAALNHESTIDRCPKDDVDFYSIQLAPSSTVDFSASLVPANQSGTLRLQLYNSNQTPLETVETAPGIPTAEIDGFSPSIADTYFLQVSVGGDEHRVTYALDASGLPGVDLAAEDLNIGAGTYQEGDQIRYDFDLVNYGGDEVDSVDYHVYIGDSASHDDGNDQFLGGFEVEDVQPDGRIEIEGLVNVPDGVDEGTKYIHVSIDPDDVHDDVNRNNNTDTVPIEIVAPSNGEEENEEENQEENGGEETEG